jgi:hypothetical protein
MIRARYFCDEFSFHLQSFDLLSLIAAAAVIHRTVRWLFCIQSALSPA